MKTTQHKKNKSSSKQKFHFAMVFTTLCISLSASSLLNPLQSTVAKAASDAEQVDVNAIKEKYWARGDETELGVIQNRTYSKKGKFEITPTYGILFSDPFLYDNVVGGALGYHFSEYLAVYAVGFKHLVSPSSALTYLQQGDASTGRVGTTAQTNQPRSYLGGEATASLFYGKLSILGKSIIYYDFHTLAGLGVTDTESGQYITPSLGLGQRFHLSQVVSLRFDYRLQYYRETILEKVVTSQLGTPRGTRDNWGNVVTLGLSFMIGK